MILITKKDCQKCEWVKDRLPPGIDIEIMDAKSPDGLSHLAYHEKVDNNKFPMLITDDERVIEGAIEIKQTLVSIMNGGV